MAEINSRLMSSGQRHLGLRARPDLTTQVSIFQNEYCWIVKDPIAMKYFRFGKAEYLVLEALQEDVSYEDLRRILVAEFPEKRIRLETIQQMVSQLHAFGLLISESTGQSRQLGKKRDQEQLQRIVRMAMSPYAIRFPGWDPESFLNWFYPKVRFFFTFWFSGFVVATCLAAATLVAVNFQSFQAKLPEFGQFFAADNLLVMMGLLVFTKSIHELGHGLMCKHFGGECHQIGFMLMVFTPAMYCDTSDSWTMPNKWHRVAIGAAGMYVEVFLAAICTFVWWFTQPGWLHFTALNIMFLSSVTTLLFNANPLLRYDGYYILSDLWEVPNLSQKANAALLSQLRVSALGMDPIQASRLPKKKVNWVVAYAVAAFVYRIFVMLAIMWFISQVLEPYGLAAFAHFFIAMSILGLVVFPMYKLAKFFSYPGRFREVKPHRFWISTALAVALVTFVCLVPLPRYVWADCVVRPLQAQNLIVTQAGRLAEIHVSAGDYVEKGQAIATLENFELELRYEETKGRLARLESDRVAYEQLSGIEPNAAKLFAETVVRIQSVKRQLHTLEDQRAGLVIRARRSGRLFAPQNSPDAYREDVELASWEDTPLAEQNLGSFFKENTLLGIIGDPHEMEVTLVVDEAQIEFVDIGQSVTALLRSFGSAFVSGRVNGVSEDELKHLPRELSQSNHGPIAVQPDSSGEEQPLMKSYEAYACFPAKELRSKGIRLLPGAIGEARIEVDRSSLGRRLVRFLATVIRFR